MTRSEGLKILLIVAVCFALAGCERNLPTATFDQMLNNLSQSYPALWRMMTAIAYVIGFVFFFTALYQMKIYGELRTMMASQANLKTPMTYMIAGSFLIYMPTAFNMLEYTVFHTTGASVLSYHGGATPSDKVNDAFYGLLQIVGLMAFIRGWVIIAKSSRTGVQANYGKGLTHVIGGLLAINIVGFSDVMYKSLFG